MKAPIVLSTVHVDIDGGGELVVDIDGEPFDAGRPVCRDDLGSLLDGITTDLDTAVRVEVREADGTTYADIAVPPQPNLDEAPPLPVAAAAMPRRGAGLAGRGFQPGEEVAVAYVVCRQIADDDGQATVQLPPALLAKSRRSLVLIGLTSTVVAEVEQPA